MMQEIEERIWCARNMDDMIDGKEDIKIYEKKR